MPTNTVKCPQCGTISKVHGVKTFVCCGTKWNIADCLVTPKGEESYEEELENSIPEEIDLNEEKSKTLPVRRKARKKVKDELICPFCGGDVYGTQRPGIYFCLKCNRYLEEE